MIGPKIRTKGEGIAMENRIEQNDNERQSSYSSWLHEVISSALTSIFFAVIPLCSLSWILGGKGLGPVWLEEAGRSALFTSAGIALFFMVWAMNPYQSGSKSAARLWFCSPTWLPIFFVGMVLWILAFYNTLTRLL